MYVCIVANNSIILNAFSSKCSHYFTIVTILTYYDYSYHIDCGSATTS